MSSDILDSIDGSKLVGIKRTVEADISIMDYDSGDDTWWVETTLNGVRIQGLWVSRDVLAQLVKEDEIKEVLKQQILDLKETLDSLEGVK